jgi:DNA primase
MEMLWRLHPEPTLCFDGDRAGRQAAFRAMDRALPILKPGKSFQFSLVEGGKDPDDVLREQGPVALRQQLAATTPFVQALFERERDLEPLDTPERRAGLKGRLRQAAATIADNDLQQAYRQDLLERYDGLFRKADSEPGARPPWRPLARRNGRWKGPGEAWADAQPPTAQGKAAAGRLAAGLDPAPAALAAYALSRPTVLDDHLEDVFATEGFGEPALCELVREIIHLRLESDHLDSDSLTRHLRSCGFNALLTDIDRAAAKSGAPFLKQDVSLEAANSQWSQAFARLSRLASLDKALDASKGNLRERSDMEAFERLKGERDALRRATREWND